ncbi:MAG: c-type cytochrome [Deltaproteobacteria bacterium]|jgi:mono/diheme cytochrome c family protein|nr:c-type cytochrome [Deltaproteobacteria bacterium]
MKAIKSCLTISAAVFCLTVASPAAFSAAKDKVPGDAKGVENPVEADDDVLKTAKKIYKKKCKKCHGSKGDGKGPGAKDMDPLPPDWTAGIDATDGELYWITMNGSADTEMKGWQAGMAKEGKEVSEEEAWGLVHYIRSLGN